MTGRVGAASLPLVAVVGRPNVGKSTLVNRFVGGHDAIVEEHAGVTRDRKELVAEWRARRFRVVDTGGWLASRGGGELEHRVSGQAERAMTEADVVVLVVDAVAGVTDEDQRVVEVLRRLDAEILLVANKVDDVRRERDLWELDRLGLGHAHPVSALHGRSSGDLLDAIVAALPPEGQTDDLPEEREFAVAIVGRPNAGKSTLFNRLVGDERSIVHDEPGTTRDAIDTLVTTEQGTIRFVDTAGLRRRSRIDELTEHVSTLRALEAADRADAALFVIDATAGVTHQDQRLAERVAGGGTAIVVVLNKWDLLDADRRDRVKAEVADRLGFLSYASVVPVSARTGRGVHKLAPALVAGRTALEGRIPTARLNRALADAERAHPPPAGGRSRPRLLYATQGATNPPTITLFTTGRLPATYLRYLERRLRESLRIGPVPLKIRVRIRRHR